MADVKLKIKIDDNLKEVAIDAGALGQALDDVMNSSKRLGQEFVKLSSVSQIAEQASSAFSQLNSAFEGLSNAYAAQSSAEARLAQAMANTMGASAEEIQSIKDLCSAQQQLGVIGDEVQLAAAQELATYLEYSDSLKTIIPVMNDMAAQQYGLGASAESVTQIATMLGKVMNGQTEALSRYGYKFDEAQKQILQYGTEAERAAVLVDVVSQSVGGMNAALAQTPVGRMQQVANTIGDWKERLGQAVQSMMPFVSSFNQLAQGITTVTKLSSAFKALANSTLGAKIQSLAMSVAQLTQAASARLLGVSETAAATATGVLKTKIIALQATLTFGLSLAITAVIELITRFIGRSKEAADAVDEVDEAVDAYRQTSSEMRSQLAMEIVELEDLIKKKKSEGEKVDELNQKYGEAFGYYSTAAEWYDVLNTKSEAYCRQLGYEAQAKVIAAKKAAKEIELEEIKAQARKMQREGKDQARNFGLVHDDAGKVAGIGFEYRETEGFSTLRSQAGDLEKEIETLGSQFDTCIGKSLEAQNDLATTFEDTHGVIAWETMSLADLSKAIQDQEAKVKSLAGTSDAAAAREENAVLKRMKARKTALESTYNLGNGSGSTSGKKDEFDGSKLIENAASYKELGNNIKYYQDLVEKTHPDEITAIADLTGKINALKAAQEAITSPTAIMSGVNIDIDSILADIERSEQQIDEKLGREEDKLLAGLKKRWDNADLASALGLNKDLVFSLSMRVDGFENAKQNIETLKKLYAAANDEEKGAIQEAIVRWQKVADAQQDYLSKGEKVVGAMGNISSAMNSLSGIVDESASGWLSWGANVLSAIAQALPQLARLIGGHIAEAFAGAAAQSQDVPFPLNIVSLAASMAAVGAAVASIPTFASGGLAYGPTLGLFGEYAGAANNPEVVAPLDKLRSLVFGGNSGTPTTITLRAHGRDLVAAISAENLFRSRG